MKTIRKSVASEMRAPAVWWLLLLVATGGALVWAISRVSPTGAWAAGVLLAVAWGAPLLALQSLAGPERAKKPPPPSGTGSFNEWIEQARMLGRLLLIVADIPELSPEVRRDVVAAREDLRDVLGAHPLRDDLERVCERIRSGALRHTQDWLAREFLPPIREQTNESQQQVQAEPDENKRLLALYTALETAAVQMTRHCMPRLLERERLDCAQQCSWLAIQGAGTGETAVSPVDLAEMLVIEWFDFSQPWLPATALQNAKVRLARLNAEGPVPPPAPALATEPAPAPSVAAPPAEEEPDGDLIVRNGKRFRRIRVRHKRRRHHRHFFGSGPSLTNIFRSFWQWVRFTIRSWVLFR